MKKIIMLTILISVIFSQDGRYERINNFKRFDTRTGETEYLIDGKWYTEEESSKRAKKLQKKQLIKFPSAQREELRGNLFVPTEPYEKKNFYNDYNPDFSLIPGYNQAPNSNYDLRLSITNNSSWKIEEVDIELNIQNKIYNFTVLFHAEGNGLPQELSVSHIILKKQILQKGQDYKWYINEVRGYDPQNPPKLNWWD